MTRWEGEVGIILAQAPWTLFSHKQSSTSSGKGSVQCDKALCVFCDLINPPIRLWILFLGDFLFLGPKDTREKQYSLDYAGCSSLDPSSVYLCASVDTQCVFGHSDGKFLSRAALDPFSGTHNYGRSGQGGAVARRPLYVSGLPVVTKVQ